MGLNWRTIPDDMRQFIEAQHLFFVATAPQDGRVNLSPKGLDTLRVLDDHTVAYLDLTGSGNETAAHVTENGRMTMMFCAFNGEAMTLRLYGRADLIRPDHDEWPLLFPLFAEFAGTRQIFRLHVESVATSCGWSIPVVGEMRERTELIEWAAAKSDDQMEAYRLANNVVSIDGLPTGYVSDDFESNPEPNRPAREPSQTTGGTAAVRSMQNDIDAADGVLLTFADGEALCFAPIEGTSLLDSAERAGAHLASNCREGTCRTCVARDRNGADVLLCVTPAQAGVALTLPYRRTDVTPPSLRRAKINAFSRVSRSVWEIRYRLQFPLTFLPGQYVEVIFPGMDTPRRFSMANPPSTHEQVLQVRDLNGGATSEYLGDRAKPGDPFTVRGPFGVFYLRSNRRPKLFVAGGTGLAPILSMLSSMDPATAPPLAVVAGFASTEDAYALQELNELAASLPLEVIVAADKGEPSGAIIKGNPVEAIARVTSLQLGLGTEAYLCGPPGMVNAARRTLVAQGMADADIFNEEFVHAGDH